MTALACVGEITVGRHLNQGFAQMVGSGEGRVQSRLSGQSLFALPSLTSRKSFRSWNCAATP